MRDAIPAPTDDHKARRRELADATRSACSRLGLRYSPVLKGGWLLTEDLLYCVQANYRVYDDQQLDIDGAVVNPWWLAFVERAVYERRWRPGQQLRRVLVANDLLASSVLSEEDAVLGGSEPMTLDAVTEGLAGQLARLRGIVPSAHAAAGHEWRWLLNQGHEPDPLALDQLLVLHAKTDAGRQLDVLDLMMTTGRGGLMFDDIRGMADAVAIFFPDSPVARRRPDWISWKAQELQGDGGFVLAAREQIAEELWRYGESDSAVALLDADKATYRRVLQAAMQPVQLRDRTGDTLLAQALALAAVEVLEGRDRPLVRTRRRPLPSVDELWALVGNSRDRRGEDPLAEAFRVTET